MARLCVLVVANTTATSPQLIEALKERAGRGGVKATLLMPCTGVGPAAREEARAALDRAIELWREAGIEDCDGVVGDSDPLIAVHETYDPLRHDEIVVSTLPEHASEWLRWDLPHRVAKLTDAHVTHVESSSRPAELHYEKPPQREKPPLGPLSILAWGHPKEETAAERERRLRALRR